MERDSHVKSCRAGIPLRGSVTHGTAYTPYLAVGRRSSIALMISSRGKQEVIIDAWLERLCNCDRMATWNQTRVEPLTSTTGPSRGWWHSSFHLLLASLPTKYRRRISKNGITASITIGIVPAVPGLPYTMRPYIRAAEPRATAQARI